MTRPCAACPCWDGREAEEIDDALYPGATIVIESPVARRWATALGIDFHEVRIQTNAHDLTLVFSELHVEELEQGDVPEG